MLLSAIFFSNFLNLLEFMFRILLFFVLLPIPLLALTNRDVGALCVQWASKAELQLGFKNMNWKFQPATQTIQVIVVVPVYRELKNGNLARLLQHFREQTASVSSFKLVLLVNNTPEVAAKKGAVWQIKRRSIGSEVRIMA